MLTACVGLAIGYIQQRRWPEQPFKTDEKQNHAKGGAARLAGVEPPPFTDDERSLAEAHARITRTLDYVATLPVEAFDAAATRIITVPFGVPQMLAPRYLYGFALPSFFFHVTTAYAILRHRGVPLGKRDFIGHSSRADLP